MEAFIKMTVDNQRNSWSRRWPIKRACPPFTNHLNMYCHLWSTLKTVEHRLLLLNKTFFLFLFLFPLFYYHSSFFFFSSVFLSDFFFNQIKITSKNSFVFSALIFSLTLLVICFFSLMNSRLTFYCFFFLLNF